MPEDNEGRQLLMERAKEGGLDWTVLAYTWPELDGCQCQGKQPNGTPCRDIRVQQVEALFAKDAARD